MSNASDLNVSMEPHLVDTLKPLLELLPPALEKDLALYVTTPIPLTIPYGTLLAISQWSRTAPGREKLQSCIPPLDPLHYSMISLLAGTTTSPERKFGDWVPKQDPGDIQAKDAQDRKAITALLNALLSIFGAGIATWWAADKTSWRRNEWRVLLSIFVAIVVAVSEGVLYSIWQSRRSNAKTKRGVRRAISARHKKDDADVSPTPDESPVIEESDETANLRRRR